MLYKFEPHTYRNGLFFCFPYIMIGSFINKYSVYTKRCNWLLLLGWGVCLLLIEIFINYKYSEKGYDILLSLYFLCPVLFIYILNKKKYSIHKTLALYSTGVYLTHMFVLRVFSKFGLLSNIPSVIVIVTFLISTLMTFFLIRIKEKFKYIL
jgi:hypothetical protein